MHDPQEKREGLDIIMAQYSGRTFEYPDENLEKTLVIKLEIDNMTEKQSRCFIVRILGGRYE